MSLFQDINLDAVLTLSLPAGSHQIFIASNQTNRRELEAVMMTGGIGLRVSGLAPERFIAVFYTGLGAALLLAGLLFGRNFGKAVLAASQSMEEKGV